MDVVRLNQQFFTGDLVAKKTDPRAHARVLVSCTKRISRIAVFPSVTTLLMNARGAGARRMKCPLWASSRDRRLILSTVHYYAGRLGCRE